MRPDETMVPVEEISPARFEERRNQGELWQLLDVREAWELDVARLPHAIHIPMAEIPGRLDELDREVPLAVLCHGGVRSARVAGFLQQAGFAPIANITGGIDRWSQDVDPTIARY